MRSAFIAALVALAGCAGSWEVGRAFEPGRLSSESGWTAAANVPVLRQSRELDCGPVATAMLLEYWGQRVEPDALRVEAGLKPDRGLAARTIRHLLRARGLVAFLVVGDVGGLQRELAAGRPVLVGMAKPFAKDEALGHYEIVIAMNPGLNEVVTVDPSFGYWTYALEVFKAQWEPTKRLTLIVGPGAE